MISFGKYANPILYYIAVVNFILWKMEEQSTEREILFSSIHCSNSTNKFALDPILRVRFTIPPIRASIRSVGVNSQPKHRS